MFQPQGLSLRLLLGTASFLAASQLLRTQVSADHSCSQETFLIPKPGGPPSPSLPQHLFALSEIPLFRMGLLLALPADRELPRLPCLSLLHPQLPAHCTCDRAIRGWTTTSEFRWEPGSCFPVFTASFLLSSNWETCLQTPGRWGLHVLGKPRQQYTRSPMGLEGNVARALLFFRGRRVNPCC